VYDASESPQRSEAELFAAIGGKAWFDVSTAGCIKVDYFAWNITDQGDLGMTPLSARAVNVASGATLRGPAALDPDRSVTYAFNITGVAKTRFQIEDDAVANGHPYAYFDIGLLCAN
jgi:multidrug efflux pump subunit AcrA (membrane-fusion protein)